MVHSRLLLLRQVAFDIRRRGVHYTVRVVASMLGSIPASAIISCSSPLSGVVAEMPGSGKFLVMVMLCHSASRLSTCLCGVSTFADNTSRHLCRFRSYAKKNRSQVFLRARRSSSWPRLFLCSWHSCPPRPFSWPYPILREPRSWTLPSESQGWA